MVEAVSAVFAVVEVQEAVVEVQEAGEEAEEEAEYIRYLFTRDAIPGGERGGGGGGGEGVFLESVNARGDSWQVGGQGLSRAWREHRPSLSTPTPAAVSPSPKALLARRHHDNISASLCHARHTLTRSCAQPCPADVPPPPFVISTVGAVNTSSFCRSMFAPFSKKEEEEDAFSKKEEEEDEEKKVAVVVVHSLD